MSSCAFGVLKAMQNFYFSRLLISSGWHGANLLFQVISAHYETGSIILTSNKAFKEWGDIFNKDAAITSAILDRLLHHCEVVTIEGKSYRMMARKK